MLYNENQQQPPKPHGVDQGIIKGAYKLIEFEDKNNTIVRLLGSGPILKYVIDAHNLLKSDFDIDSEVWSVTSYGELRREGLDVQRNNTLFPHDIKKSYVENCFGDDIPTVAVSDHISAVPEMIQRWVGGQFIVLGTDGYGRSDTREALREFFEIDTNNIVLGALSALEKEEQIPAGSVEKAVNILGINRERKDKTE